jgi:DNA-binding transcriptional MerR regulator
VRQNTYEWPYRSGRARAAHLSVRTLHHYHEVGLLEPSEIDSGTGYRYYSFEQIPTAQVIRRLRGLEMPVADVKAVLAAADSEARYRLIVEHLDRLEAELAHTQAAVGELRDLLQRPQVSHPVEHRTVAPTAAVGSTTSSTARTSSPGGRALWANSTPPSARRS